MLNHPPREEFCQDPIRIFLAATCDCCTFLSHCHREHYLSGITTYLLPPTTSQQEFFNTYIETSDSDFSLLGISVMFGFSSYRIHHPQLAYASERSGSWRWETTNLPRFFVLAIYCQRHVELDGPSICICLFFLFCTWNISNSIQSNRSQFVLAFEVCCICFRPRESWASISLPTFQNSINCFDETHYLYLKLCIIYILTLSWSQ